MNERYDGTSRRRLLQAGVLGAGAIAAPGVLGSTTAAASTTKIDTEHPRFTLAVVPDTQYQFDQDRGDAAPLTATFEYLIDQRGEQNIVFVAHLGDVVENALASEFAQADPVFRILDRAQIGRASCRERV